MLSDVKGSPASLRVNITRGSICRANLTSDF